MTRTVANLATRSLSRGNLCRVACALAALFALGACKSETPVRRLLGIAPSSMPSDAPVEITIQGEGFDAVPSVALNSRGTAALDLRYRVELPPSDFQTVVTARRGTELKFTPPEMLPAQVYDVRVVPPLGAAMVLPGALTILPAGTPFDPRRLTLETRADGEGEVISARTLSLNERLTVHAVLRESDGSLSSSSEPVQFEFSPNLVELSEVEDRRCVVRALLPGTVTLSAVLDTLRAELELTLSDDAQRALDDLQLSLEDAPGGAGEPLGTGRTEVAGTRLTVHAVVRDKSDAFVVDLPVRWLLNDSQTPVESTSYELQLMAAGSNSLRALHEALGSAELTVDVTAGPASQLLIEPEARSLRAGDEAVMFSVSGLDAYGNPTTDLGEIAYSVSEGSLSAFDAQTGTLTPELVGTGRVSAKSSYGAEVTTGSIQISAGPLARLSISPETVQLTADSEPVQFEVTGYDAFDNQADVGEVTWSIGDGPIASLSADGELDPSVAGVGSVLATSDNGVSAASGPITISGGKAMALSIAPGTWQGVIGGATQAFEVFGIDSDGNLTEDLGTISYAVTGPIRTIEALTGVLTPTVSGVGTVTATSSYGPSVSTGDVVVSNPNASLSILDLRVSGTLYHGATTRMEVDVRSNDVVDAVLTGLGFTFTNSNAADISSQYSVIADNGNRDRVAPNMTQTLVYHLSVAPNAAYEGTVNTTVRGDAYMSAGTVVSPSRTVSSNVSYPAFGTTLTIDAPVPPADRTCVGGRITFGATANSSFGYTWRFGEGSMLAPGSSLNDRNPAVDYSTVGPKPNAVTASYTLLLLFTYPTTLVGKPVFVGTATSVLADTYPTGRIVFSSPTAEQAVALASFPRSDLIVLDPAVPVRQCNNVAVDATGHNDLTVFSDRRLIDPAVDSDPSAPGIQVELTAQGGLPSLPLLASQSEGPTSVYAEYFEPNSGKVTAAGDQTFNLTGDSTAPSVLFSVPASDCTSACLKTRDPLVFQFSEPMWLPSLSNVSVDLYSMSSTCSDMFSDWTDASTRAYDSAENALYVTTPSRSGTYSVRVRIPGTVSDAATARNALPALTRCVVFSTLADPALPAKPQLTAAPTAVFSPDNDQSNESLSWQVAVDGATTLLRLRITRAGKAVYGKLLPVTQAGTYSLSWDGADSSGRIVSNGAYGYAIEALNRAGTASAALRGYVEVESAVRFVTVRRAQ